MQVSLSVVIFRVVVWAGWFWSCYLVSTVVYFTRYAEFHCNLITTRRIILVTFEDHVMEHILFILSNCCFSLIYVYVMFSDPGFIEKKTLNEKVSNLAPISYPP